MKSIAICEVSDLLVNAGICVTVAGEQVAIFYHPDDNAIYAIGNYDPFSQVNVLSRGLMGDLQGQPVVVSPLYKQHFNLETGVCLEDEQVSIPTYPVFIQDNWVYLHS